MTNEALNKQITAALSVLANADYVSLETVNFISNAVTEKLNSEEVPVVGKQDYIEALSDRAKRMTDAGLGKFVKGTLWTASTTYKKGDGY